MKILSWNINGIRAGRDKTSVKDILDSLDSDIVCLQETKVTRDMIDEPTAIVDGYDAFFSFSRKKSGYSGTANYCVPRARPCAAEEGLTGRLSDGGDTVVGHYGNTEHLSNADLESLDSEGRCTLTSHQIRLGDGSVGRVVVINVYVPLAGDRADRLTYKLQFLGAVQGRAEALLARGLHVIILGDLNLTHRQIDNCDVETQDENFTHKSSRIWFNNMLRKEERDKSLPRTTGELAELCLPDATGGHFSDAFRRLHPTQGQAFTCWCTATEARKANYGRRLDYILVSCPLAAAALTSCQILADVHGSDHCPVLLTLNCDPIPSEVTPSLCSRLMPEFRGQQQKLSSFFTKAVSAAASKSDFGHVKVEGFAFKCSQNNSVNKSGSDSVLSLKRSGVKRSGSDMTGVKAKCLKSGSKGKQQSSLASFFSMEKTKKSDSNAKPTPYYEPLLELQKEKIDIYNNETNLDTLKDYKSKGSEYNKSNYVNLCENNNDEARTSKSINQDLTSSENSQSQTSSLKSSSRSSSQAWKSLLGGLPPAPLCPGHSEPCVLKVVKKSGPNRNRQFYSCARPDGPPGHKDFRCNFFKWLEDVRKKASK